MCKVRMRHKVPTTSFRQDAAMAGAIFMSNSISRELCFRMSIFGLPLEYESFVNNVKEGMPLFLFDHSERKLYGVFEAASDGRLNINRDAFWSIGRPYSAQVRFNIIWKCRPLTEDEFYPAIEENYYTARKFYFDLSYQQVVQLYMLFDNKRVERPIYNCSRNAELETKHSSKGTPDRRSLTPNIPPPPVDQSHILMPATSTPNISAVETNHSTTSMHPIVPLSVGTQPNVSMPLGTKVFGVHIAPVSSHHDQREFPDHSNELFPTASRVDGISTVVSAPCSQTTRHWQDQLVANQPYPLSHDYLHSSLLPSGYMTQDLTNGIRMVANRSYPSSHDYERSRLLSPGYMTLDPTDRDSNYVSSTVPAYAPSYPHFSLSNPQGNASWQDHCDVFCNQCHGGPHNEIYASDHRLFSEGKAQAYPKLSQQGIPSYPEVSEYGGHMVPAIGQQKENFSDYISIPDCREDFDNDQTKHDIHRNAPGSSNLRDDIRAYMSDHLYTNSDIGVESNTTVPGKRPQSSVFSRLSLNQQPPSQETTGPSLNELVYSLAQRTKQSSNDNRTFTDVGKQSVSEQVMDRPYSHAEQNLPSQLEAEESTEPPFLNFKRRSKAGKVDANLGKEINGKLKRRKLVRPSFGEDNAASSGKEPQGNDVENRKHGHLEVGGNKFDIDLNRPACVDSDLMEDDDSIVLCPAVVEMQTEKPFEVSMNKSNCLNVEAMDKQDPSLDNAAPSEKFSLGLNVTDLNAMDTSKLQTILGQTSSFLQAYGKHTSGECNNSEQARSSICGEDRKVNMLMCSDRSTTPSCN